MLPTTATLVNVLLALGLAQAQIVPFIVPRDDMVARGNAQQKPGAKNTDGANESPHKRAPAASSTGTVPSGASQSPAPAAAAPASNAVACAQAAILAQGIALNIADQQQELATANSMATLLQAQTLDTNAYNTARTNLLQFITNGVAIRQTNQAITPSGNQATSGLATVANAQMQEMSLATSLTGNAASDLGIVQQLQTDFAGGIQQNTKNMADALAGCGSTATAATGATPAQAAGASAAGASNGSSAAKGGSAAKVVARVGGGNDHPGSKTSAKFFFS